MNYIELINHFWLKRRTCPLGTSEADLYYFLLQESNIRGWENPFMCSNKLACGILNISERTLIEARKSLRRKGFIGFTPGQRNHRSPIYNIGAIKQMNEVSPSLSPPRGGVGEATKDETAKGRATKGETDKDKAAKNVSPKVKNRVFVIPTTDEVAAYCAERQNGIDARHFIDFYQSRGWLTGKSKMKDWKAAVRNWEYRERERAAGGKAAHNQAKHDNDRHYDKF